MREQEDILRMPKGKEMWKDGERLDFILFRYKIKQNVLFY